MKKTLTLAMLMIASTLLFVGCGQIIKSPADTVITPDAATIQKQQEFDQAMIQKQNVLGENGKGV